MLDLNERMSDENAMIYIPDDHKRQIEDNKP